LKRIVVLPNTDKDTGLVFAKRVANALSSRADVYMENAFENSGINAKYLPHDELYNTADIAIVLGGDGTILRCAHICAEKQIPILGINLGTIGFMSEVEPAGIEFALERLLKDDYIVQKRMMMQINVYNGNKVNTYYALNDAVISTSLNSKLAHTQLYSEKELVNTYIADGMIIATPTGSTAYSLSAGGPVADPLMQIFIATPICAHMLTSRSTIISAEKTITLTFDPGYPSNLNISVDGDVVDNIDISSRIVIKKADFDTLLIKIQNRSFYDTLIMKLR